MATVVREQLNGTTTILDLPYEVITQICSNNVLTTTDIYNLAKSHPKLNDCLYNGENSSFWKAKYEQKYDDSNINEFEIANNLHNTWRNEIMFRMNLNKSVIKEIMQMPSKYMRFNNIPYHEYPFGEELNSNNQNCQYYIYYSTLHFYKNVSTQCEKKNQDVEYMAQQFLMYVSKVFYGYKIKDFLSLPLAEQTNERGFYLLGRWWYPTDLSYNDLRGHLDAITLVLYDYIYRKENLHSMFKNGYDSDSIIRNGKSNLDHDLYSEDETVIILKHISDYIFKRKVKVLCPCHYKEDCFLLKMVTDCFNGTLFLSYVLYEAIARRLGVKIEITLLPNHIFIFWKSSWPRRVREIPTLFSVNICNSRGEQITVNRPKERLLPENSVPDILWKFCNFIKHHGNQFNDTFRNAENFQKLIRPNDAIFQSSDHSYPEGYKFCSCPLIRTPLSPLAPKHINEQSNMYEEFEDIFPLVPKRRGTNTDPHYSIGMMVVVIACFTQSQGFTSKHGVIVGWSKVPDSEKHKYHLLFDHPGKTISSGEYRTPVIENIIDGETGIICRKIENIYTFINMGKYFKYYDRELCACVPIDALAECYPDDFAHTVNSSKHIGNLNIDLVAE